MFISSAMACAWLVLMMGARCTVGAEDDGAGDDIAEPPVLGIAATATPFGRRVGEEEIDLNANGALTWQPLRGNREEPWPLRDGP